MWLQFDIVTTYRNLSRSDDSDHDNNDDYGYDGDDECSEDDETENELGLNNGGECCGRRMITRDTCEKKFELVPKEKDITTTKPFKLKKTTKSKQSKLSRPLQLKGQKPMRNDTMEKQKSSGVTDRPMYAWDGGTVQYHPIKGPHCEYSTTAADDKDSCTTSCVQCFDED